MNGKSKQPLIQATSRCLIYLDPLRINNIIKSDVPWPISSSDSHIGSSSRPVRMGETGIPTFVTGTFVIRTTCLIR